MYEAMLRMALNQLTGSESQVGKYSATDKLLVYKGTTETKSIGMSFFGKEYLAVKAKSTNMYSSKAQVDFGDCNKAKLEDDSPFGLARQTTLRSSLNEQQAWFSSELLYSLQEIKNCSGKSSLLNVR